jgi:hypothetical protein
MYLFIFIYFLFVDENKINSLRFDWEISLPDGGMKGMEVFDVLLLFYVLFI